MCGVKLALLGTLVSVTAVQAFPWWGDIGTAHGVRSEPISLAQLGRRNTESDQAKGFQWRSLAQNDEPGDDKLRLRSRKLPPYDVLDANGDGVITDDEWTGYVEKLLNKAVRIIKQGSDKVATDFLLDIAKFHYDNLNDCILSEIVSLGSVDFNEIALELQHRCYIKLRYSLYAGPAPFELVSNSASTVQAHELDTWLTIQLDIARHDMEQNRIYKMNSDDELHLEQLVACAHEKLVPWDEMELNRDDYYAALNEIVQCA
ncbi:hypothetical protein DVH05_001209 [Phytophthora capsici]|nr:hypothetical protein DVH05_001209 [Phytophthora capsici]|eukprot:jgi/Phyca11/507167/fgenesh2_kg.PHYCAscaffold_25_\